MKNYDAKKLKLARDAYAAASTPEEMLATLKHDRVPAAYISHLGELDVLCGRIDRKRWWGDVALLKAHFPFPKDDGRKPHFDR